MTPAETTQHDDAALVAVINRDACINQICYPVPGHKQILCKLTGLPTVSTPETRAIRLLPGLNFVPWGELRMAHFDPRDFRGRLIVRKPEDLQDYEAVELAGETTSKTALRTWLEAETRPEVRGAIQAALSPKQAVQAEE